NRRARGVLDRRRRGKIGEPLREVDAPVKLIEARHLANHRFGELGGSSGAGELRHLSDYAAFRLLLFLVAGFDAFFAGVFFGGAFFADTFAVFGGGAPTPCAADASFTAGISLST